METLSVSLRFSGSHAGLSIGATFFFWTTTLWVGTFLWTPAFLAAKAGDVTSNASERTNIARIIGCFSFRFAAQDPIIRICPTTDNSGQTVQDKAVRAVRYEERIKKLRGLAATCNPPPLKSRPLLCGGLPRFHDALTLRINTDIDAGLVAAFALIGVGDDLALVLVDAPVGVTRSGRGH